MSGLRLHDAIEFHGRQRPGATALRDGTRSWIFAELDRQSGRFAALLRDAGVSRGDRFAVLAANCLEYFAWYYGAAKAGAVIVPLNPRLAPPEWAYIVGDSGARLVVARGDLVEPCATIVGDCPGVGEWLSLGHEPPDGWEDLAERGDRVGPWLPDEPPVGSADPVVQMYTSGTTGRPKGAVLSHGALTASIAQSSAANHDGLGGCGHIVAPLAHIGSALTSMLNLAAGGSAFVQEDFDMPEVVRILDEEGVNRTMLVPAMIQALLVFVPDIADRSFDDLEQIGYGASPIAPEVLRQAMDVFGCEFTQGYGCTESCGGLTLLGPADHRRALEEQPGLLESAGLPALGTQVRVVGDDGSDLAPGEVGEIIARGPQLMTEYWNLPEASEAALRDGWLHTGDAGTFDEDGYLYVKDRIKDMIVSGGENVYPAEVEHVLIEHPSVADVAVIGVPDERWGEAVKACVVAAPEETIDPEDVLAFCRERLAGFKTPKSVDVLDELPRNASMKVLKTELRAPYWEGQDRSVS
ncbi:MAG: long-chain-fatty-acid--CoA ligase [Actinomycetota bacterium]